MTNGTGTPVEDVAPRDSFYASVTRKMPSGIAFFPEQKLTRLEALRSYTRDCAYASFEEDIILFCAEEEIRSTKIVSTIVGGKIAFGVD